MKCNTLGLNLIKSLEGCKLTAYKLKGERNYTIGYGHTDSSIKAGQKITQLQADNYLKTDLEKFEKYVEKHSKFALNENQFSALVSYTYNRGYKGFKQLIDNSNESNLSDNIVKYWGTNTNYKTALINRRKKEQKLFNTPVNVSRETIVIPTKTLRRGDMGVEVELLQKFLNLNNPKIHLDVDGKFGNLTYNAVKLFQKNNGLRQTGIYDTAMYNKFVELKRRVGL